MGRESWSNASLLARGAGSGLCGSGSGSGNGSRLLVAAWRLEAISTLCRGLLLSCQALEAEHACLQLMIAML